MERNIKIAYFLTVLKNSWYWLGIWVFYYLLFTNYAGIGLLETLLIGSAILGEIPTGAIADLLGKKKTLLIALFLLTAGLFAIGLTPNFLVLTIGVLIAGIGMSFYSGTIEALIYDSLKELKKEGKYHRVIANIGSLQLIAPAITGLMGGFIYLYSPRLPFILHGISYFFGFLLCFFFVEPHFDTEKFSLKSFFIQTMQGFGELTKTIDISNQTILLISIGAIVVIADEMLNGFLAVEFGFNEQLAGVFWSTVYVISSIISQLTPGFVKYFDENKSILISGIMIGITFVISPYLGLFLGGISLLVRSSFQVTFFNLASILINKNTESKYRATTLSTFNMLKNIPYVLFAFLIGSMADKYSAKVIAFWLGIVLFSLLFFQIKQRRQIS